MTYRDPPNHGETWCQHWQQYWTPIRCMTGPWTLDTTMHQTSGRRMLRPSLLSANNPPTAQSHQGNLLIAASPNKLKAHSCIERHRRLPDSHPWQLPVLVPKYQRLVNMLHIGPKTIRSFMTSFETGHRSCYCCHGNCQTRFNHLGWASMTISHAHASQFDLQAMNLVWLMSESILSLPLLCLIVVLMVDEWK